MKKSKLVLTLSSVIIFFLLVSGPTIAEDALYIDGYGNLEMFGTMAIFGEWESKSFNTVYQAPSDGFVIFWAGSTTTFSIVILTDSNNPPTIGRGMAAASLDCPWGGAMSPIRKGDYWKASVNYGWITQGQLWWIPLGQ